MTSVDRGYTGGIPELPRRVPLENATELVAVVGSRGRRDESDPSYANFGRLASL